MDRCAQCGAALTAAAAWCGQCFLPVAAAAASPSSSVGFVPAGAAPRQVAMRTTRWAKTSTTFGPVGRVGCTVALVAVLVLLVVGGFVDTFAWGGAVIWAGVVMPWALRDVWQEGRAPIG